MEAHLIACLFTPPKTRYVFGRPCWCCQKSPRSVAWFQIVWTVYGTWQLHSSTCNKVDTRTAHTVSVTRFEWVSSHQPGPWWLLIRCFSMTQSHSNVLGIVPPGPTAAYSGRGWGSGRMSLNCSWSQTVDRCNVEAKLQEPQFHILSIYQAKSILFGKSSVSNGGLGCLLSWRGRGSETQRRRVMRFLCCALHWPCIQLMAMTLSERWF